MVKRKLMVLAIAASILIVILGCELSGEITFGSVTGDVVDARTDSLVGVENVTVTFTKVDGGSSQEVTTSSNGSYSLEYDGEGEYRVTASKGGWFFIPQTVYIGNWRSGVPDTLGIELDPNIKVRNEAISFILTWNSSYKDLDSYLTFPDGAGSGYEGSHQPVSDNEFTYPNSPLPSGGTGFGPDTTSNREKIYWYSTASLNEVGAVLGEDPLDYNYDDRPAVELDRDDMNGNGPEVITVRSLPFWISGYQTITYGITGNSTNRLPETVGTNNVEWTWIGVMEYYVDGWNGTTEDSSRGEGDDHLISAADGSGAEAVLHIVQGDNLLGVYKVPEYADIRTASLVKVNLFLGAVENTDPTEYVSLFQFVPDIQLIDYDDGMGIRSVEDGEPYVINAFGAVR